MNLNRIGKFIILNMAIITINTYIFSTNSIDFNSTNTFKMSFFSMLFIMSVIIFFWGNYKLISTENLKTQDESLSSRENCIVLLKKIQNSTYFKERVTLILDQIEAMTNKISKITEIIEKNYNIIDPVYDKFRNIIFEVEYIFYENINSVINKINAFDESDYRRIINSKDKKIHNKDFVKSKLMIFEEYFNFVDISISNNEEILLKLDSMLLEISKINTMDIENFNKITEVNELDKLIKKFKV